MAVTGTLQGRALIRKQPSYYTAEQALQYLQRVGWTEGDYTAEDIAGGRFPASFENLDIIVRRHYISFANDTTPMHYSAEHYLDVTPEATFKRLVTDRAGGTYCYGHHNLMLGIIRALGYRSYSGIARMNFGIFGNGEDAYQAYGHMILFVQLGAGQGTDPAHTWVVDCAPGPPVPMHPFPLSADPENVIPHAIPPETTRLTRGFSPASSLVVPGSGPGAASDYDAKQATEVFDAHALWQVEYCSGPGTHMAEYRIVYQFMEQEFQLSDYNVQHYAKMFKPNEDVFSDDVVCMRYALADGKTELPVTERPLLRLSLFRGVFKMRSGSEVLEKIVCKTEKDRIGVLRKYFGIALEEKDTVHIKGRSASIEKALPLSPELEALL